MRKLLSMLASLKVTVVLVLLIGVVLSAGTILESLRGSEAAKGVYEASWFYALLCVFAANVVAALVERWPRNRWRIGFVITHAAMLLILFGAFVTLVAKREGQIALWEGQDTKTVVERPGASGQPASFTLPFAIRLDDFQMDLYPGTRRPAMFRSLVQVLDSSRARYSFQEDEPMKALKYTIAIVCVLGALWVFHRLRVLAREEPR